MNLPQGGVKMVFLSWCSSKQSVSLLSSGTVHFPNLLPPRLKSNHTHRNPSHYTTIAIGLSRGRHQWLFHFKRCSYGRHRERRQTLFSPRTCRVGNGVLEEQRKGLILYCTTRHTSLKFPSRHIFAQQPFSMRIQHFFSTDISFSADICCALFNSQNSFFLAHRRHL